MTSKSNRSRRASPRGISRDAVQIMIQEHTQETDARIVEMLAELRAQGQRLDHVLETLRTLVEKVTGGQTGDGLEKSVMRHDASLVAHDERLTRLTREVFGDGTPGIHELIRDHSRRWQLMSRLSWLAITTIAGIVASIAVRVF